MWWIKSKNQNTNEYFNSLFYFSCYLNHRKHQVQPKNKRIMLIFIFHQFSVRYWIIRHHHHHQWINRKSFRLYLFLHRQFKVVMLMFKQSKRFHPRYQLQLLINHRQSKKKKKKHLFHLYNHYHRLSTCFSRIWMELMNGSIDFVSVIKEYKMIFIRFE